MISRVDIQNFKSFSGEHELPLAPVTLVYGPNSAGKSTLVQSLAMLKQTFANASGGNDAGLAFRGDLVDLGGFMTSVSNHDSKLTMGFGLEFSRPEGPDDHGTPRREAIYAGLNFVAGENGGSRQSLARLGIGSGSGLKTSGSEFLSFRSDEHGDYVFSDDASEGAIVDLINAHAEIKRRDQDAVSSRNLQRLARNVRAALNQGREPVFFSGGFFPSVPRPGFLEDHKWDIELSLWFEEHLHSQVRDLSTILERLRYLGPLRAIPARYQDMGDQSALDVGFSGEHTAQLLWRRPDLRAEVNEALEELEVKYSLSILEVAPERRADESELDELRIEPLVSTRLVHRESKVATTPKDVGFGVSQMLPVVVQLLVNEGATLCIEQPEVHIHPRLQARVGELIVKSAIEKKNQVIVETHSEALINRIRLLLARSDHPLSPEDVQVLYIDDRNGIARPSSLRLDDMGEFLDPWPDGFFAESDTDEALRRSKLVARRKESEMPAETRPPLVMDENDELWD